MRKGRSLDDLGGDGRDSFGGRMLRGAVVDS